MRVLTALLLGFGLACSASHAALVAHYPFDEAADGTSPDSVSNNFVTLGAAASHTTDAFVGAGALLMDGTLATADPNDGAITSNDFSWDVDSRTISFWVNGPGVDGGGILYANNNQSFVSMGVNATGERFSVKTQGNSDELRVEIQGTGQPMGVPIADETWHHVAVVVPNDNAAFSQIIPYVDGVEIDNPSENTLAVNTATAPINIGQEVGTFADRVATGRIDDVAIWDEALSVDDISLLMEVSTSNVLDGNAGVFSAARTAHGAGPGGVAAFDGLVWSYADGLTGGPISGSGDEFSITFDASAGTGASSSTYFTGDVNLDNLVNLDDLEVIAGNFLEGVSSLTDGDLTGDGVVDYSDFRLWKDNSTVPAGALALGIPEPSSLVLCFMLGLAAVSRAICRKTRT